MLLFIYHAGQTQKLIFSPYQVLRHRPLILYSGCIGLDMELLGSFRQVLGGSLLRRNGVEAREAKYKGRSLMTGEKTSCRCNADPPIQT